MGCGEWHKCTTAIVLLILGSVFRTCDGQDFGYDGDRGPTHWGEQYNSCFGKHQSPININSLTVKPQHFPPFCLKGFDILPNQTTITNNGHTAMVTIEADPAPSITGGPLNGQYEFSQLHFHWGENDTMGSEDLIDGQSFPMELHMVFYKKQYRNIRSAMNEADGLAVLAFFYHIDDELNQNYVEFTELLMNISDAETSVSFQQTKSIHDLLLGELSDYYTYNGSLTTPPCSEVVTWIDFKHSIPLSHAQIDVFRTIRDEEGNRLTHNFRPIQPLGDRVVFYSPPPAQYPYALDDPILIITEPEQGIDLVPLINNDPYRSANDESNTHHAVDDIDRDVKPIGSDQTNELDHPKNTKKRKNAAHSMHSISCDAIITIAGALSLVLTFDWIR